MQNKKWEANLAMIVSRVFAGVNVNALKFLLPLWLVPAVGVAIRLVFGAAAFWIISLFVREPSVTVRRRVQMLLLGAVGMFGYMYLYLTGVSKTTPVSSAIFNSLQPIWVFLFSAIFLSEKISAKKVVGLLGGLIGALLCIFTQKGADVASDPLAGDLYNFACSLLFAGYLLVSNKLLKSVGTITLMKYVFTGAAVPGVILAWCTSGAAVPGVILAWCTSGHSALFTHAATWQPIAALAFILIFPTVLSYLLIPIGLKYLSTTVVSIYNYLMLVVTTVIALAVGQDHFSWTQLCAILLIFGSVYLVEAAENDAHRLPRQAHGMN